MPANENPERDIVRTVDSAGGKAEPQAGGLVQGLSLSSGELEDGATSGSEGGVPLRRNVPRVGFIVPILEASQSVDGAALEEAEYGGTMDQGRQAGGEDNATELPSRNTNEVRLWLNLIAYNLGDLWRRLTLPVEDPAFVADQFATTIGEARRTLVNHARYYWLISPRAI